MKHIPQRSCIICRQKRPKRELVRIVQAQDGVVRVDEGGKANGRGAYLCRQPDCWKQALADKGTRIASRLSAALKTPVSNEDAAALVQYAEHLALAMTNEVRKPPE